MASTNNIKFDDTPEYQKNLTEFENFIEIPKDTVESKCNNLRNDIETSVVNFIKIVNEHKNALFNHIDLILSTI
jgi:hypothetical protein